MRARVDEVVPVALLGHDLAVEQPHDDLDALHHAVALRHRIDAEHHRVGRQQAGADAEHHASARLMVELDDAVRRHQRVVIRQRHHAGAEADVFGALGGGGDEDLGRGDDFEAGRVVLADPGFLVAQPIQVLDQFKVAVQSFSWILVERMERRQEDAIAHRYRASHSSGASFRLPTFAEQFRISHIRRC